MKIETLLEKERFQKHLSYQKNIRILFSGKFGSGKTEFLHDFFKTQSQIYLPIFLYPTNYSVATNEDIMEYIKIDILVELLKFVQVDDTKFTNKELIFPFIMEELYPFIGSLLEKLPVIGKSISLIKSSILKLADHYEEFKKKYNNTEWEKIQSFLKKQLNIEGNIYEYDSMSQTISNLINKIHSSCKKDVVLIIDDLDRVDPEHIFRILNVFATQSEEYSSNSTNNKFNFNKIIAVCDIINLREIFKTRYGGNTDFNGYIDKFYSREVFHFNFTRDITNSITKIVTNFALPDNKSYIYSCQKDILRSILCHLLLINQITLRSLICTQKIDLSTYSYQSQYGQVVSCEPVWVLYQYLKALYHTEDRIVNAVSILLSSFPNFDIENKNNATIAGYFCAFIYFRGFYSYKENFVIETKNIKYLCKTEMPEKELYSYQLCEIQDKKRKKKSFPLYSLVLESLRLCKRIVQNGKRWDNF